MYPNELLEHVVRPTLAGLGAAFASPAAEQLIIGTIWQESRGRHLKQINGHTLGICQIEPSTHTDIWLNFLAFRPSLASRLSALVPVYSGDHPPHSSLVSNLAYAVAVCRVHFMRVSEALPSAGMSKDWLDIGKSITTQVQAGELERIYGEFPRNPLILGRCPCSSITVTTRGNSLHMTFSRTMQHATCST